MVSYIYDKLPMISRNHRNHFRAEEPFTKEKHLKSHICYKKKRVHHGGGLQRRV